MTKKDYIVVSNLDYQIIQAETEQKAFVEAMTTEPELKTVGASKEDIRQDLLKRGYKTMTKTNIKNIYLLS